MLHQETGSEVDGNDWNSKRVKSFAVRRFTIFAGNSAPRTRTASVQRHATNRRKPSHKKFPELFFRGRFGK